jgi:cathepsin B
MKAILILILGLSLSMAHETEPLITREHIENLKSVAGFEVLDYESHPFKDWSVEDFKKRLGLRKIEGQPKQEIFYGDNDGLPETFDSRTQWPNCVHQIRDQQSCGSCWAFAASEVLSDRFCIATKGATNVVLSPQDLVSCDSQDYGCQGGYVDKSWDYIRDTGIVSDECLPYTSGDGDSGTCPFNSSKKCKKGTFKKYKVSKHNQHTTIADAKNSLVNEGPIETGFEVYDDFMSYSGGVYRRTSDSLLGGHAVKIVGWGKDTDGTEYWIVANSWNTNWGEKGFFRIAFGECDFEGSMWSGTPVTTEENHLFLH